MGDKYIKEIVSSYLTNNEIFGNSTYKADEYNDVDKYQQSLKSTHANHIKTTKSNTKQISAYSSPLNNINFSKTVSMGINDKFKHSAFYLLSSLYSQKYNKLLIDGERLAILFKSGLGVMDLPYSLILYFGGLHYFNKNKTKGILGDSNFYETAKVLDGGEKCLNIYPLGDNSPKYETNEIKILNNYSYFDRYKKTNFIPKFGYGTLSNFMNDYYNFVSDRTKQTDSGFTTDLNEPFHIYGAEKGFVKSFKTYSDNLTNVEITDDPINKVNFMGHYTILKNSYNFTDLKNDTLAIPNEFKTAATAVINGLSSNSGMNITTNLRKLFLVYSKLKTNYLYNTQGFNLNDEVTALNNTIPTTFKYRYKGNELKNKCGIFSFFVYTMLFDKKTPPVGSYVELSKLINDIGVPKSIFKDLIDDKNINIENTVLVNFLKYFWDKEKEYMDDHNDNYSITSNFLVMLYPSSGGIFSPNNLFNIDKTKYSIGAYTASSDDHSLYLRTTDKESLRELSFDNRSVIENSTRFLWYDTANAGAQLGSKDYVDTSYILHYYNSQLTDLSYLTGTGATDNFFNNIYKGSDGIMSLLGKNSINIQDLYEIIDFEKFEYFEEKFLEFATRYADTTGTYYNETSYNDWIFTKNNDNFTFETLIKAMTTIGDNDISSVDATNIDSNFTNTDFVYFLIGYSSYNYYFCDYFGISKIINAFLTLCQYNKNESDTGVLNEFLKQKLSINNYSNIGAVTLPGQVNTLYTNYHNYMFRPDVIFSATDNNFGDTNLNYLSYYINKLIFGDNDTNTYKTVANIDVLMYVEKYINPNKKDKLKKAYTKMDIAVMLNFFFSFLNVELNENNFKLLYNLFIGLVNSGEVFANITTDPTGSIEYYLIQFINDFYKNTQSGINIFLRNIYLKTSDKANPNSPNSLYKQTVSADKLLDLKTSTYYNIKNIYDKFVSYQPAPPDIKLIKEKFTEYNDLSISTGEFNKTNGLLFYNYMFKDLSATNNPDNSMSLNSIYDASTPRHLAEYLNIVDRANNNVGTEILINIIDFADAIQLKFDASGSNDNSELTNKSVYSVFSDIASHNGFLLHPINSYVSYLSNLKNVTGDELLRQYAYNIFGLHTNTDRIDSNPSFSLQWVNHTSSLLDQKTNTLSNQKLTNSFCLDIDLYNNTTKLLDEGNIPKDIKESSGNVTAFVVDFGNKNQQMFKNIQLDTSEFSNTEESINSYVNLVANGNQASKVVSGNLFKLMETRSYTCQVETLGNALIQPMNYFYLKNVPLFKGSYLITNVDHKLTPNNMVTTFKGVRQPIIAKTNNREEILNSVEKTLNDITKSVNQQVGSDTTKGIILQDRNNLDATPYGMFYQSMVSSPQNGNYPGIQILYALISSEFPSQSNDLYKLFISVIYNRAKYWAQKNEKSVKPSIVTKYMVDVALTLSANYMNSDVKPYFHESNPNNGASLSQLTNNYKVDPTNPIYITLTEIAKAKDTAAVIKLLKPNNLTSQKLSITLKSNGNNYNSNGNNFIFTVSGKDAKSEPLIVYDKELDNNKDFSKAWQAFDIIYMQGINSDPAKIYTTNVNNESTYEYIYLNPFAVNDLTLNYNTKDLTYLGCYDNKRGITFFAKTFDDTVVDNYASDIVNFSPKTLFSAYSSVANGNIRNFNQNDINYAYNFYVNNGFSQTASSAIVGSFLQESGLNPTIVNFNKKLPADDSNQTYAAGIAQWIGLGGRRSKMLMFAKDKGILIPNYEEAVSTYSDWSESPFKKRGKQQDTLTIIRNAFSNMTLQVELEYTLVELKKYKDFNKFKITNDFNFATNWMYVIYEGGNYSAGAALGNRVVYAKKILNGINLV